MTQKKTFVDRHIGPTQSSIEEMAVFLNGEPKNTSINNLIENTIPKSIRLKNELNLPLAQSEFEAIEDLKKIMSKNLVFRSYIGTGYVNTITPPVIQRNILENPGWYTQYTPYQSEIAQGRLEALLNFQTMIMDLTGLEIANASMLDEATSAAEAMTMSFHLTGKESEKYFWISQSCHPQTISVVETRAKFAGIKTKVGSDQDLEKSIEEKKCFGVLFQYPESFGEVRDYTEIIKKIQNSGALVTMACDLMSLAVLKSPAEMGADIAIGNTQCFGVPMGFGGPHAAFFATKEPYKRALPGRIVGVSKDAEGNPAIRLALQTREQHIRRDKATSNICTSQVLLAIMSSMYAVYHGAAGIKECALEIFRKTSTLKNSILKNGYSSLKCITINHFNTLQFEGSEEHISFIHEKSQNKKINFRKISKTKIGFTLDESVVESDLLNILECFGGKNLEVFSENFPKWIERKTTYLKQTIFNQIHSETEMLRYISKLQSKDLSLAFSMIPLGSCTMKLNATTEMLPVTWNEVSSLHPFSPLEQTKGYRELFEKLESYLCEITGFDAVSLQPNAGSQGEFAGLLTIKKFHEVNGNPNRDICLIPQSAHGTNPASAVMAGFKVVVVNCDKAGNVDLEDLRNKSKEHSKNLGALMITYPSTHGVFEENVIEFCKIIHENGGQVYMDGANMNAQVGLCRPGDFGPDVCHLNLHKTFCIPHGGGGPGMGPIGVKKHLAPYLPNHPLVEIIENQTNSVGSVSAAPFGSASILPISYLYIRMMGAKGLKRATEIAILNANYIAKKLSPHFPILYKGEKDTVAHECIIDLRPLKETTGVEVEDIAKRLMDYGFHAPTVSFPVPGTMMIEPTESESKPEIDRFISAMISIRNEIEEIKNGKADRTINVLKNAPHTMNKVMSSEWNYPYSREKAAFPAQWVKEWKFWPSVARIDNVYGERNLNCSCVGIEEYRA